MADAEVGDAAGDAGGDAAGDAAGEAAGEASEAASGAAGSGTTSDASARTRESAVRDLAGAVGVEVRVGVLVRELTALLARAFAAVGDAPAGSVRMAGAALARQEARDIVAAIADMPRFWPTTNPTEWLDPDTVAAARRAAAERARGAPFAYAVARAPFRHLTLDVDDRVLIPRQETEVLVDVVLECAAEREGGIAVDVGTGSGAIALALASEGRFERVIATDVSRGALAVAERNVRRFAAVLRAPVELRHGSLLAPVRDVRARVVVSNPPYIAHGEAGALPASVRDWEPPIALFSGGDGMAATTVLVRDAAHVLEPGGWLALEIDSRRASLAAELALADGRYRDVSVRLDLAGRERILLARRTDQ